MPFDPGDYVNSPLNNDLGRTLRYDVRPVQKAREIAYEVMRYNPSGQGWHVATYDNLETATLIAAMHKAAADKEVH